MAYFEGTIQEFHHYLGPKLKNAINIFSKRNRDSLGGKCEHCQEIKELQSAHVKGKGRRKIIEAILQNHISDEIVYCDIKLVESEILQAHLPIEESFKFLCQGCHVRYDSSEAKHEENAPQAADSPSVNRMSDSQGAHRKWNLNLRHRWYETQVPGGSGIERIRFGITNHQNQKVELGEFNLNYAGMYEVGLIRKVGADYRVRIYFDSPGFYISARRGDSDRLVLPVKFADT